MDKLFCEGFAKAAVEAGVPAEQVPALLEHSLLMELLSKDAAFREGFEAELEKAGQHFWKNTLGGMGAGALGGAGVGSVVPGLGTGVGTVVGGVGGALAGAWRGIKQNINDPNNVANKYNQQRNQWMQQRQQKDQMYGMGGRGGQWPRPGYGMPSRWSGGYGEPGWY